MRGALIGTGAAVVTLAVAGCGAAGWTPRQQAEVRSVFCQPGTTSSARQCTCILEAWEAHTSGTDFQSLEASDRSMDAAEQKAFAQASVCAPANQ